MKIIHNGGAYIITPEFVAIKILEFMYLPKFLKENIERHKENLAKLIEEHGSFETDEIIDVYFTYSFKGHARVDIESTQKEPEYLTLRTRLRQYLHMFKIWNPELYENVAQKNGIEKIWWVQGKKLWLEGSPAEERFDKELEDMEHE